MGMGWLAAPRPELAAFDSSACLGPSRVRTPQGLQSLTAELAAKVRLGLALAEPRLKGIIPCGASVPLSTGKKI